MSLSLVERVKMSVATVKELSILSGISYNIVANWVQGKSTPKANDAEQMESALEAISGLPKEKIRVLVQYKKDNPDKPIKVQKDDSIINHKNDETMINRAFDLIEKRLEKDDERWERLMSAHEKLISIIAVKNSESERGMAQKRGMLSITSTSYHAKEGAVRKNTQYIPLTKFRTFLDKITTFLLIQKIKNRYCKGFQTF